MPAYSKPQQIRPRTYTAEQAATFYIDRWFNLRTPLLSETAPCCTVYHATRGRGMHQRGIVHVAHLTGVPIYEIRKAVLAELERRLRSRLQASSRAG